MALRISAPDRTRRFDSMDHRRLGLAAFSQVSQNVSLIGKGANCQVNGVLFTRDKQQFTYNTLQHH
ncbi:MAG: hypothetical protein R3C56_35780 [Pirellulaceae bacterium]